MIIALVKFLIKAELMKLSKKILGLSLIPISLLLLGSIISGRYVYESNKETNSYVVDYVDRQVKVYEILRNLGYGGGIHTFKNYILRFKDTDRESSTRSLRRSRSIVIEYLLLPGLSVEEIEAMTEVKNVIDKYLSKITIIEDMILKGYARSSIDKKVKVNDAAALSGLANLQDYFKRSRNKHLLKLKDSNTKALNSLIILFLIAIILSILMSRTLSRRIISSIKRLVRISEEISAGITIDKKRNIQAFDDDELKVLATQMIKMSEELSILFKELNQSNNQLRASNEELTDFAYVASHDLQEPVKKISSYIDLLEMEMDKDISQEAQLYMGILKSSSVNMIDLIKALLNYSKVGSEELETEKINLSDILEQSKKNLELIIKEQRVEFIVSELPMVVGNKKLLESLFQNIISNSIKYKKKDCALKIRIDANITKNNRSEITISDNGIGFDMKYLDTVLRPFGRIHSKAEYPGVGIGLPLCRKIVESHGGRLNIQSSEFIGCSVSFTLESYL